MATLNKCGLTVIRWCCFAGSYSAFLLESLLPVRSGGNIHYCRSFGSRNSGFLFQIHDELSHSLHNFIKQHNCFQHWW